MGPLIFLGGRLGIDKALEALEAYPAFSTAVSYSAIGLALIAGVMLLAMLYSQLPNTYVFYRSALTGAALAVPLWLAGRWGFGLYVSRVAGKSVYGALGLIPLFLMWLNLSWWIFLFGTQLAHSVSHLGRLHRAGRAERLILGSWDFLAAILAIARRQQVGDAPVNLDDIADSLGLRGDDAERLLTQLCETQLICRVADERKRLYVLVKPAETLSVTDVLQLGGQGPAAAIGDKDIIQRVAGVRRLAEGGISSVTIAQVVRNEQQAGGRNENDQLR